MWEFGGASPHSCSSGWMVHKVMDLYSNIKILVHEKKDVSLSEYSLESEVF